MSKTAKFYDQEALEYDDKRWQSEAGKYTNAVQQQIVEQLAGYIASRKVLELGVGTGRFTKLLTDKKAQVTGIDISLSMLYQTRAALPPNSNLVQANGTHLPFPENYFDGVVTINVFSHLPDYTAALYNIAHVLRPGGFFIVNFPNLWSYYLPAGVWVNFRKRAVNRDVFTHWYSIQTFQKACKQAGFDIVQIVGQTQIKEKMSNTGLEKLFKKLDQISRQTTLRYLSPTIFLKLTKIA